MTRRPTKAQRRAALAELLAGLPEPAELPPECDMAEASTTSEVSTAKSISITEDGRTLHGTGWVLPQDYSEKEEVQNCTSTMSAEAEVLDGALPSMKGTTPPTLPTLGDDQADDDGRGG